MKGTYKQTAGHDGFSTFNGSPAPPLLSLVVRRGRRGLEVWGFDGCSRVRDEGELLARLRSDRRGPDGAFVLSHGGAESLWVHVHGDAAFLWFQPARDGRHPGFVPDGMWPGERRGVRFLQTSGYPADAI